MRHLTPIVVLTTLTLLSLTSRGQPDEAPSQPAGRPSTERSPVASLRVAAVQMRSTRDLAVNVQRIRDHLKQCKSDGVRVAVFPECALTGYFDEAYHRALRAEQLAEAEQQLGAACRESDIYAIVGTTTRDDADKLFDSAIVIDPNGKIIERYHKIQLAERWPEAGRQLSVFRVDGVPCSIIICHDERYPELVRLPVLAGARVVFYVSHESGMREEHKLGPYRAQVQARAVENTVYLVHANAPANDDGGGSHGQSRVIAPDGRILREASMFKDEIISETLDLSKATRAFALNSLRRGPFADWWADGVKRVRIVE
jgi:predicted amidohydrolase